MNIVIDGRLLGTSTGRYVEKLLQHLQDIDHENTYTVLVNKSGWTPSADNFVAKEVSVPRFSLKEQIALKSILNELNPDLVHFTDFNQPLGYKGATVTTIHDLTMLRFKNKRPGETLYNLKYEFKYQLLSRFMKKAINQSTRIIATSEFTREDILSHANNSNITVTYESADMIDTAPEPVKDLADSKFAFYVGNAYPHKNLGILIDAMKIAIERDTKLKLVIAGKKDAFHQQIIDRANVEIPDNFIHTGFVSEGELRWLYENCRTHVFPSLSEGFGLPGLEAMAHGAPVLSSSATCLPEVYGNAALYFDPNNVGELSDKMVAITTDEGLRKHRIELGKAKVAEYSWRRMAEQTYEIYKDALS